MKRLVYSPRVEAYIKADTGVYDISPYIVSCKLDRKIDQVSSAEVEFRNPDFKWTEHRFTDPLTKQKVVGPVFHPMDPIVISMTRLHDRPIQVFTGYCDSTPYLQLFPGTVTLTASCTLKRLLYTYVDPGLPFVREWLSERGWTISESGIQHPQAESKGGKDGPKATGDSGIGQLLKDVLTDIGHWDEKNIYIEDLPSQIVDLVTNLFTISRHESDEAQQEINDLIHRIIGTSTISTSGNSGTGSVSGDSPPSGSKVTPEQVGTEMIRAGFPLDATVIASGISTVSGESGFGTAPGWDQEHDNGVLGYWQIQRSSHDVSRECCMNLECSTKAALGIWRENHCFACLAGPNPWQAGTDSGGQYLAVGQHLVALAKQGKLTQQGTDAGNRKGQTRP